MKETAGEREKEGGSELMFLGASILGKEGRTGRREGEGGVIGDSNSLYMAVTV